MRNAPANYNTAHDPELYQLDGLDVTPGYTTGARIQRAFQGAARCAAGCGTEILPGDSIQVGLDGQAEHSECPDSLTIPKQGVCGGCWLVLPVVGICGVC